MYVDSLVLQDKGNSFNTEDVKFKSYLKWKSYVKK